MWLGQFCWSSKLKQWKRKNLQNKSQVGLWCSHGKIKDGTYIMSLNCFPISLPLFSELVHLIQNLFWELHLALIEKFLFAVVKLCLHCRLFRFPLWISWIRSCLPCCRSWCPLEAFSDCKQKTHQKEVQEHSCLVSIMRENLNKYYWI